MSDSKTGRGQSVLSMDGNLGVGSEEGGISHAWRMDGSWRMYARSRGVNEHADGMHS